MVFQRKATVIYSDQFVLKNSIFLKMTEIQVQLAIFGNSGPLRANWGSLEACHGLVRASWGPSEAESLMAGLYEYRFVYVSTRYHFVSMSVPWNCTEMAMYSKIGYGSQFSKKKWFLNPLLGFKDNMHSLSKVKILILAITTFIASRFLLLFIFKISNNWLIKYHI